MNNFNFNDKFINRLFRKVDNVKWDLMTGKIGIQTADGILTLDGEGEDARVSINPLDSFSMVIPAFAQSTPVDAVKVGDLIYNSKKEVGWIVEITDGKFYKLNTNGDIGRWNPPKVHLMGFDSGVLVLRSLMNMLPNGNAGLGQMQQMMQMMMFMGGDMDMDQMIPFMLMSQMGNITSDDGTTVPNPIGGVNVNNMMQTMMMMKMFGGMMGGSGNSNNRNKIGVPFFDQ